MVAGLRKRPAIFVGFNNLTTKAFPFLRERCPKDG